MTKTAIKNKIIELEGVISTIKGTRFASFTYLSKSAGELARHTIQLGFSYHELVQRSIEELALLMVDGETTWNSIQKQAAEELMASFNKTMAAHSRGEQNPDYTKRDQYIPLVNGISINTTDGSVQVFGLKVAKKVLREGTHSVVNSRPLTLAKNEIRNQLSVGKFKEFALDAGHILRARVQGETIELA
jgi:hypothetical protein